MAMMNSMLGRRRNFFAAEATGLGLAGNGAVPKTETHRPALPRVWKAPATLCPVSRQSCLLLGEKKLCFMPEPFLGLSRRILAGFMPNSHIAVMVR